MWGKQCEGVSSWAEVWLEAARPLGWLSLSRMLLGEFELGSVGSG